MAKSFSPLTSFISSNQSRLGAALAILLLITTAMPVYLSGDGQSYVNIFELMPVYAFGLIAPTLHMVALFAMFWRGRWARTVYAWAVFIGLSFNLEATGPTSDSSGPQDFYALTSGVIWIIAIITVAAILIQYIVQKRKALKLQKVEPAQNKEIHMPVRQPIWKLALLSISTSGIYNIYWLWKDWRSVVPKKKLGVKSFISEAISFIFPYTFYSRHKIEHAAILSLLYTIIWIGPPTLPYKLKILVSLLSFVPLIPIQRKLNGKESLLPQAQKVSPKELTIIILGASVIALSLLV